MKRRNLRIGGPCTNDGKIGWLTSTISNIWYMSLSTSSFALRITMDYPPKTSFSIMMPAFHIMKLSNAIAIGHSKKDGHACMLPSASHSPIWITSYRRRSTSQLSRTGGKVFIVKRIMSTEWYNSTVVCCIFRTGNGWYPKGFYHGKFQYKQVKHLKYIE